MCFDLIGDGVIAATQNASIPKEFKILRDVQLRRRAAVKVSAARLRKSEDFEIIAVTLERGRSKAKPRASDIGPAGESD
ncbi:hypothetical protein [Methylosinus sp. Ce-a6]|uniref:hypothetical protein n=1 Tax=Methylosinus sp. Ce-a6 TaxID=2172005 RepID=UPI00135918E0|nr:hypothetical protein [Methylosinus sp. Ce-a6]